MDKVCKDIVTGEKRQNEKKTKLGILYWQNGANKPYKLKKAFKTKRICQFPFTISCHSLKGISVFTPLPTGEGHFYVFYYLCHYDFCPLCHDGFCIILSVIMTSGLYVIMASVHSVCHFGFCLLCHYGFCSFCLSSWLLSLMSLRLLFPCYFVFYILCPLCLPFILSGLEGLICKVFLRTY